MENIIGNDAIRCFMFQGTMAASGLWLTYITRASLLVLVGEHLELVLISSTITVLIGIPLGIWVTRPSGKDFLPIITDITSFGQAFPPVAVLALAVPMFGFGLLPTVIALFLEGAVPAAILAVIADQLLTGIEELFA